MRINEILILLSLLDVSAYPWQSDKSLQEEIIAYLQQEVIPYFPPECMQFAQNKLMHFLSQKAAGQLFDANNDRLYSEFKSQSKLQSQTRLKPLSKQQSRSQFGYAPSRTFSTQEFDKTFAAGPLKRNGVKSNAKANDSVRNSRDGFSFSNPFYNGVYSPQTPLFYPQLGPVLNPQMLEDEEDAYFPEVSSFAVKKQGQNPFDQQYGPHNSYDQQQGYGRYGQSYGPRYDQYDQQYSRQYDQRQDYGQYGQPYGQPYGARPNFLSPQLEQNDMYPNPTNLEKPGLAKQNESHSDQKAQNNQDKAESNPLQECFNKFDQWRRLLRKGQNIASDISLDSEVDQLALFQKDPKTGQNLLHEAILSQNLEVFNHILQLWDQVLSDSPEIIFQDGNFLFNGSAFSSLIDVSGNNPLHTMAKLDRIMTSAGVDEFLRAFEQSSYFSKDMLYTTNHNGKTPLLLALENDNDDVIKSFLTVFDFRVFLEAAFTEGPSALSLFPLIFSEAVDETGKAYCIACTQKILKNIYKRDDILSFFSQRDAQQRSLLEIILDVEKWGKPDLLRAVVASVHDENGNNFFHIAQIEETVFDKIVSYIDPSELLDKVNTKNSEGISPIQDFVKTSRYEKIASLMRVIPILDWIANVRLEEDEPWLHGLVKEDNYREFFKITLESLCLADMKRSEIIKLLSIQDSKGKTVLDLASSPIYQDLLRQSPLLLP